MPSPYDPKAISDYFDDFADAEWDRLVKNHESEINLAVHLHHLRRAIEPGMRVLEIGAGAGRFTVELLRIGAKVVVTDVSEVQLRLNTENVAEHVPDGRVDDRLQLDVVDMSMLEDESFDAVVCFGGPLSYVMDRRDEALQECLRVLKPGGRFLASVMSLWGSVRAGLPFVLGVPREANDRIIASGDITSEALPGHRHVCHAFRSAEFAAFLRDGGVDVEVLSAAGCLSPAWGERLDEVRADPERWEELIQMEIQASAEPGFVAGGRHIIGVGRKRV